MDDPTPNDRVPLDRPPVPRFSPLPDLPDLPELPRGSAMVPTPSIPIPAPPLPPPRVMVDLPRPSPSVSIDPPKPRPAPPVLSKPAANPPVPTPTPVVASTPAPKGRWVGEAFATLLTPTKSKATVLAAAGSLVAGAFALQLLVGSGGETATTKPAKTVEVAAEEPPVGSPGLDDRCNMKPSPNNADVPSSQKDSPFLSTDADTGRTSDPSNLLTPQSTAGLPVPPTPNLQTPRLTPPVMLARVNSEIVPVAGEAPPVPVPAPGIPDLNLPVLPPPPVGAPTTPAPTSIPATTPTPAAPPPMPVPTPAVPTPVTPPTPTPAQAAAPPKPLALPQPVTASPKPIDLPMPINPPTPIDLPKPIDSPKLPVTPAIKPVEPEPIKPIVSAPSGFTELPQAVPTPQLQPFVPPTPAAPVQLPAVSGFDSAPQPKPVAPTPAPATDVRTDFDVDLHPAKAGQTYEAVSLQHYSDAKYADALRRFNKDRDPGRDELQIPPTHVLRKLTAGSRAPAAAATANPVTPAAGEGWARPAALDGVKPVAGGRSYTVPQDGTTFRDLAGTLLNDRALYRRISDLNPTIDGNAQLRKGDVIRVP